MRPLLLFCSIVSAFSSPAAIWARPARDHALRVDRVVMIMRHGVRSPTMSPPVPAGIAADPWPAWDVKPGWLTPHGATAIASVARWDRRHFAAEGLLARSRCPTVRVVADSDERTIATAIAYANASLPACNVVIEHKSEGEADPLFSAGRTDAGLYDLDAARAAVRRVAAGGSLSGEDHALRGARKELDAILCGRATAGCGVSTLPSSLELPKGDKPRLTGALGVATTVAQVLLLQYADGWPMAKVGWGRTSAAQIERLSRFHSTEFALLARPRYFAARNAAGIAAIVRNAVTATRSDAPVITVVSGHDTTIANIAGLLDVHWHVDGFAPDDPPPGSALVIERLSDRAGRHYIRVAYRSQTLEQLRHLTTLGEHRDAVWTPLRIPGCHLLMPHDMCPLRRFTALLDTD